MNSDERLWFAGVDWASESHQVRLSDARGNKVGERSFAHGGEGLAELANWMLRLSNAPPDGIHIAIEVPHGPVVESLMERGFHVYAINPKQLDRFRDRFSPAGAKDDSRDAWVLCDALRTDPRCFRALSTLDPVLIELREWSRITEELRHERNRLGSRVRELLWRYYPQRDCHDFRVWAGIMGKKESHYVTTQRAGDPGRSSGSTAGRQRRSCSAGSRRIARYAEESAGRTGAQCRDGSSSGRR